MHKVYQQPRALTFEKLREIALRYVSRYATSEAKLSGYLHRKIRERGWSLDEPEPNIEALVADFVRLGFIDDTAFAAARARVMTQRGMGLRRVNEDLRAKGITEIRSADARAQAERDRWVAADRFARRKKFGPYAETIASPALFQKQMQAFLRAGHSFETAKVFLQATPGQLLEFETFD